MKMPCTRQEEQQDQREAQRVLFRSTFNRNSSGFRYSNQQNIHSFALPNPHHQNQHEHQHEHGNHQSVAIIPQSSSPALFNLNGSVNISEDMTEQIRISVRDTHITPDGEVGGNLSDDLSGMEESYLAYYNSLQHRGYLENNSSIGLVSRNLQNNISVSQTLPNVPTASTSSSTSTSNAPPSPSTSSSRIETNSPQQQSNSNARQSRRLIVLGKERNSDPNWETSQNSDLLDLSQHSTETKNSKNLVTNETNESKKEQKKEKASSQRPVQGQTSEFQSEPSQALSIIDIIPFYKNNQAGVIKSYLFNGSSFSGQQNSSKESYEVNVKLQHVDYDSSYLNGYLCIAHLTKTHPTLTTFFEGEIISERYPFLTRKWEATEKIDRAHWSKFPGFSKDFFSESFDYNQLENSDYIYMRWKELFLVPDHTIKNIDGASYAGFYYVCYSKRTSQIKGYYFHVADQIESFQSLDLELDCEERTSQVYEFR